MRSSGVKKRCQSSGAACFSCGIQAQIISEGDDVELVGWVMAAGEFDVLGRLGGALRGRPCFTGEEIDVGVTGTSPYHSTSVGKSPVISAS